jgi:hypothetical protein
VKCSWVKCSEGLSNGVSNIIRRYTDHMKFAAYMAFSFYYILSRSLGSIFYHCIYGCMFCMLLSNFVNYVFILLGLCILIMCMYFFYVYVFLLLYVFCSVYSVFAVLFYVLFACKCVLYFCHRVSTQLQSYIISYAMELMDINTVCTGYRNNYHSVITIQHKQQFYYFYYCFYNNKNSS